MTCVCQKQFQKSLFSAFARWTQTALRKQAPGGRRAEDAVAAAARGGAGEQRRERRGLRARLARRAERGGRRGARQRPAGAERSTRCTAHSVL